MRVTENTNFETIRESVRKSRERMSGLQNQFATLKKINAPSDDPVGASKVLETRTDKVNTEQFLVNAKMAETYLKSSEQAIGEMSELVLRAKEIAIGQSNGYGSNESTRLGIAEEVSQLYQQAVAIANRRIGDRYIFAGYQTNKPPVDVNGTYQGDDGKMMVEIGRDSYVTMNISGHEVFNTQYDQVQKQSIDTEGRQIANVGPDGQAAETEAAMGFKENLNVFDQLNALRVSLLSGDVESVRATLDKSDQLHAHLVAMRSRIGSRLNGIESASGSLERQGITNAELSSKLEDADMAQVVSDLAKEETVFRSALQSSQKLIQPTLLDFLK